jgi:Holliday junction resolvase
MAEKYFQTKVANHLRSLGCFVMVISPQPGIPNGTSDIFFCKEGFYGWIECKARKNAPFQPLQERFVAKMDKWSWAKVAYPENWQEIKTELATVMI